MINSFEACLARKAYRLLIDSLATANDYQLIVWSLDARVHISAVTAEWPFHCTDEKIIFGVNQIVTMAYRMRIPPP